MSLVLEGAVFPVVLDACVLYPYELRCLLLETAEEGLYRVHWSSRILDEVVRNLVGDGRVEPARAERLVSLMSTAFPEAQVDVPDAIFSGLPCDEGDRHVLAAALVAKAEVIVTSNLRHFPAQELEPYGVMVQSPDQFLCSLLDLEPITVQECLLRISTQQRNPRRTVGELLRILQREAPVFVSRCQEFYGSGLQPG